ncbi:hypothetical protein HDU82_007874 [Entophlyctis luteolus]|nr:hypothetical protein HDU82_007874 [Entophlyctis luteolus]
MFKLLKSECFSTKNSSVAPSKLSSKISEPKDAQLGLSNLTLNAASKDDLDTVGDLNNGRNAETNSAADAAKITQEESAGQDGPTGVLSIRVVETRYLHLAAKFPVSTESAGEKERNALSNNQHQFTMPFMVLEFDKNESVAWGKEMKVDDNGRVAPGNIVLWNFRANFDVSREDDLVITVYQKDFEKRGDNALGTARITLNFDQRLQDKWFPILPISSPTASSGAPTTPQSNVGEVRLQLLFKPHSESSAKPIGVDDFEILKVLGKGSFGKVVQVRKRDTGRVYAMKILKKSSIVQRDEVQHTLAERNVLAKVSHPFIVNIKFSFQTKDKLYLVLAFVNGGELFHHLQLEGRFSEERAKIYAAELLSALDCLHSHGIIYRDLKPENILLDCTGHIALCDFGLCKFNMVEGSKTSTFCGTPEYLAPEILLGQGYTKSVDWWTLGILIYEMLVGLPPFYDENQAEMYKRIVSDELRFPSELIANNPAVIDLITKARPLLLDRDPKSRLGADGAGSIKAHEFFADINWQRLNARKYKPVFRPEVKNNADTSNFDQEFTSEVARDSVADPAERLSESQQPQFEGFSYRGDALGSVQVGSIMNRVSVGLRGSVFGGRASNAVKSGLRRGWEE